MTTELIVENMDDPERISAQQSEVQVGQWYWVPSEGDPDWLGCVVHIGSNYAKFKSVQGGSQRVHFDNLDTCRFEPIPESIIDRETQALRLSARRIMQQIKDVTASLGIVPRKAIASEDGECHALSIGSSGQDMGSYKNILILAKDELLPNLFKELKYVNQQLAHWMVAETLPLQAECKAMNGTIKLVEDRIFNIGLYAGLTEEAKCVRKGKAATENDKLHLMQRMHFMDEECISGYQVGGIDIEKLRDFDRWACRKENFQRIFPFPKCAVAFRVRKQTKERDWEGSLTSLFVNMQLGDMDKLTFLYVRNGERLYRVSTDIDFGTLLFPNQTEFNSKNSWAKMFGGSVEKIITDGEYQEILKEHREKERAFNEWAKKNPKKSWIEGPNRSYMYLRNYRPFSPDDVYCDDIAEHIGDQIKAYNRIVLIVQGLFDRSECLHPHKPVRLWDAVGFEEAVTLIRDHDHALYSGGKPDFEAYRTACNATIKKGSITVGQEDFWELKEGEKECARRDRDWRSSRETYRPKRWEPYGNPGPGLLAQVASLSGGHATFRWSRNRKSTRGEAIPATLRVPITSLLNVDAYQKGDFKQFYDDPRTRSEYLKWSVMLLAAEEYHAGNFPIHQSSRDLRKKTKHDAD